MASADHRIQGRVDTDAAARAASPTMASAMAPTPTENADLQALERRVGDVAVLGGDAVVHEHAQQREPGFNGEQSCGGSGAGDPHTSC